MNLTARWNLRGKHSLELHVGTLLFMDFGVYSDIVVVSSEAFCGEEGYFKRDEWPDLLDRLHAMGVDTKPLEEMMETSTRTLDEESRIC